MSDPQMHYGCGFSTLDQLQSWFTARELRKLDRLGYKMVQFEADVIIAETPSQVVFGCRLPLACLHPRISLTSKLAKAA